MDSWLSLTSNTDCYPFDPFTWDKWFVGRPELSQPEITRFLIRQ